MMANSVTTESHAALNILREEMPTIAPSIPVDLVETVYRIEERVQFDEDRREAAQKIRKAVEAALEKESLKG